MAKKLSNRTIVHSLITLIGRILRSKWIQVSTIIFVSLIVLGANFANIYQNKHQNDPYIYGVSFSTKFARELGLDWPKAYLAIIEDLNIQKIRIMSYWDEYEQSEGVHDFSGLDWQLDEAHKNNLKVSLAVGLRQPRWPECHYPTWTSNISPEELNKQLLEYIEIVILRYRHHPALESYQLENEVANRTFGECPKFDRAFLQEEADLIRKLDPKHALIINVSNQSGIPVFEPIGDKIGFSVYKQADGNILGLHFNWRFFYVPPGWHSLRAYAINKLHPSPVFIHELQAEPWGPDSIANLTKVQQEAIFSPTSIKTNVVYAQKTGIHEMYLWGAEWWYWRIHEYGDTRYWESANEVFGR
jgi:hypothetical protein